MADLSHRSDSDDLDLSEEMSPADGSPASEGSQTDSSLPIQRPGPPPAPPSFFTVRASIRDEEVRQLVGSAGLATEAFDLARRSVPIQPSLLQELHGLAAAVVGREAASWTVFASLLSGTAVLFAWWLPGGISVWGGIGVLVFLVAVGLRVDVVGTLVREAAEARRVAQIVRDIDAHNASVRRVRVVVRLQEAGAEVDGELLERAEAVLAEGRERLVTALRVDRVLREEGAASYGPLAIEGTAAETLARDAADREAWLRRAIEEAEATLTVRDDLTARDDEIRRLRA